MGYTLTYNQQNRNLEGSLPQGTYTVDGLAVGQSVLSGDLPLTVHDTPLNVAHMTLASRPLVTVNVKEEFTGVENSANTVGPVAHVRGPRRYLNVRLVPADDFAQNGGTLRDPARHGDEALVFEDMSPGRYWVRVDSTRGYAVSIDSGGVDLQREPLVIADAAATPPIEITMRDDFAQVDGKVEGADPALTTTNIQVAALLGVDPPGAHSIFAHVYCVPLPDSPGRFTEASVLPDGTFSVPNLPPASYRILAFKETAELEYLNPEAMRAYEAVGQVIHLTGGQSEHVTLSLTERSAP
jgi:hypothetical protein